MAHVDETGQPVLTFRGSTSVVGEAQIGVWIRNAEAGSSARSRNGRRSP
ncbi:MAG: hypothetical protein WDM92_00865 [Caulobacteraceae bacterium]